MSYSETITRTDLTNILNEVLPIYDNENIVYGEVLTSTVANTTKTNVSKLVLDAGTWLIVFDSAIGVGSSKQFQSTITYNGSDKASEQGGSALSGLVRHNLSWIGKFTTQATVYGTMYHNSGSSLSTNTNTLYAIRIVQTPRPTPLVDYIVEQGTSGIWTYRKWNSGIAECWGKYSKTVSISASSQVAISPPLFPFTINDAVVNATGGGTGNPNVFVTYQSALSAGTGADIYWRNFGGSAFNNTAWVYISVKGKWK